MQHYVIIAQMRVGYQLLANLLNSHPQILSLGEIFVDSESVRTSSMFDTNIPIYQPDQNPVVYIKDNIDPYAEQHGCKIAGFKLNYRQPEMWGFVRNWKVIHLSRKNLLDRMISEQLATNEENWNFHDYSTKLKLSAEEVAMYCEDSIFTSNSVDQFFNPYKIYYEDLVENTELVLSNLLNYLDVNPCKLTTIMKKQRSKGQSYYIDNYKEFYRQLIKTKYKKYLTDIPIF